MTEVKKLKLDFFRSKPVLHDTLFYEHFNLFLCVSLQ